MTTPAVKALTGRHGIPVVDHQTIDAFLTPADGEAECTLLFFAGLDMDRPETSDVAVVMPQLLGAYKDRLRGAMIDPASEAGLKGRFAVLMVPSLVLSRGDAILDVFPKIIDWSDYVVRIDAHVGKTAPIKSVVHQ